MGSVFQRFLQFEKHKDQLRKSKVWIFVVNIVDLGPQPTGGFTSRDVITWFCCHGEKQTSWWVTCMFNKIQLKCCKFFLNLNTKKELTIRKAEKQKDFLPFDKYYSKLLFFFFPKHLIMLQFLIHSFRILNNNFNISLKVFCWKIPGNYRHSSEWRLMSSSKILLRKRSTTLEWVAQGRGGITIPRDV